MVSPQLTGTSPSDLAVSVPFPGCAVSCRGWRTRGRSLRRTPGSCRSCSSTSLQVLEEGTREYQYARNTLIEMNLSLVRFAARRFRNRGDGDMEDITQVGTIGLIKAIDRFDLSREVEFSTFAVPYIVGEIKRFFRDTTWAVHVPRRLQELRVDLAKAKEELGNPRPRPHRQGARRPPRPHGGRGHRGHRRHQRLHRRLPRHPRPGREGPGRRPHLRRHPGRGRPGHDRGRPARPRPAAAGPRRPRTPDHRDALRPGDDPVAESATSSASPRCTSPGSSPAPCPSSAKGSSPTARSA